MKIHLIEKYGRMRRVSDTERKWQSGYWTVAKETAESLVGGDIYLHSTQSKPSKFGGVIESYRIEQSPEFQGKIVFTFLAGMEHKSISTSKEGWGNEKKIVRDDDSR